ncbi:MAG: 16S rRNA (guanine(966)-N(2))-methyltransferase RsmD [Nitrospirae bacterium]|nr:16S rRNA (guanine(966)-N(2))-methyltransferase RsmD [Nitrospirota bacterium]
MKIIAGSLKGKNVAFKHSAALRPTPAKVREALFNIIRDRVRDSSFADLYAGSGAVGFEALSRGARSVVFVDIDRHAIDDIKKHTVFYDNPLNAAICSDAVAFACKFAHDTLHGRPQAPFDIVFADAPYNSGEIERLLPALGDSSVFSENAVAIIEHSSRQVMPASTGSLVLLKTYKYGDTSLSVYSYTCPHDY